MVRSRAAFGVMLLMGLAGCGSPTAPTPPVVVPVEVPPVVVTPPAPTPQPPVPTPPPAIVTATVGGTVTDAASLLPIEGADLDLIVTSEQRYKTRTDAAGRFLLAGVPLGVRAELRIDATGHVSQTQMIDVTGDATIPVVLTAAVVVPPPSAFTTILRVVDAISRGGIGGALLTGVGLLAPATASDGRVTVSADSSDTTPRRVTITRSGYLTRETFLRVPGSAADLDLIPESIGLRDFDDLARKDGAIRRWTEALPLYVSISVVQFIGGDHTRGYSIGPRVPVADVESLTADLSGAMDDLTGGTFDFSSRSHFGFSSGVLAVSGRVTVYRVTGLGVEFGWAGATSVELSGDRITGAVVLFDDDFDRTASGSDRVRVRSHELGHAVGYEHVNRASVMSIINGFASPLGTWDRQAMAIAYSRAPGNRSPDRDPDGTTPNRSVGRHWTPFVGSPHRR